MLIGAFLSSLRLLLITEILGLIFGMAFFQKFYVTFHLNFNLCELVLKQGICILHSALGFIPGSTKILIEYLFSVMSQ